MDMGTMYKVSIKDRRKTETFALREIEKAYDSLKNKDSVYARGIKQLQDCQRAVCDIYDNAPDEIRESHANA